MVTVPVVSARVFPKGRTEACCGDRRAPLCNRRSMIIAPRQRVSGVHEAFLPVAGFRGATGQIGASGAIAEAHLDLQTSAPRARPPIATTQTVPRPYLTNGVSL
jgi:hypothetical protein